MLTDQPILLSLPQLFDALPDGVIYYRAVRDTEDQHIIDFVIGYANPAVPESAPHQVTIGTSVRHDNEHDNADTDQMFTRLEAVIDTGRAHEFEHYNQTINEWLCTICTKAGDGVLSISRINTTQKQIALEARRQADFVSNVLDASSNGIVAERAIRDENGQIVDFQITSANRRAAEIVGSTVDALIDRSDLELHPNLRSSGLFDAYVKTVETGQPQVVETYYNDGRLDYWLDVRTRKLADEELVITFADVSDLKHGQLALAGSAANLQTVIDTSQTGIFLFSPVRSHSHGAEMGEVIDFRFRMANRMLASYVGQEPEAVIGALGSEWFPDYKTNGLFDAYLKTYLTGETQRFDMHYDGGGIDVWLDIMSTKMGDEVLVTFGDYTSLKRLQQELESSVVDLQRSNANLEQFAYVASHDLQEPLRKIQAFGDILETRYGPVIGEQGADMIRRMQSAAARMQVLIRDVLAYSRVATKRDAVGPVDLELLVANVVDDLETAIADQQATVTVDLLPTLTGDAGQLRQLFQNLLSNALKFVKPQPSGQPAPEQPTALITVTARTLKGHDAGIAIPPGDADRLFYLIEIADNGIGFEPHQAERIFQVFQRLHSRSNYEGTGIGLAIVRKVVENHSGHIQAVGRPGEGATFRILLPV